jgi:hypothetical protein
MGRTFLVTRTTVAQRMLLTPRPELDARILAAVERALELHPVDLHAYSFLSNRAAVLLSGDTRGDLSGFLARVFQPISLAVVQVYAWRRGVWTARSHVTALDPLRAIGALRLVHAGAVLDGWIHHPLDWPGVSSAAALAGRGDVPGIRLAPLPAHAALSGDERAALFRQMLDAIAAEGAVARRGSPPLGRRWIAERDPRLPDPRSADYAMWEEFEQRRVTPCGGHG